ncbi:MAG: alginate export family protein [Woeseiaceae bacterium]|nr:alginate export family protein [Woeseiaceae bacterium]
MSGIRAALQVATAILPLGVYGPVAQGNANSGIADAISNGNVSTSVRYRYENVDDDRFSEQADASTARLRLSLATGAWQAWSGFAEFDYVAHVAMRDFNSGAGTSPGRAQFPVVADPSGADLNQLYVDYGSPHNLRVRIGRQRILLDNQRFVGGVGWRQNEQTYDALTLRSTAFGKTSITYNYINYVRRIFGNDVAAGKNKTDSHLLNANIKLNEHWSLVPYAYYLDYDDAANAANSTATYGARILGKLALDQGDISLTAEFASQSDAANNPVSFDADYWHLDASLAPGEQWSFGVGMESLGGNATPGGAFRTPLATLHKFQGWADQFLSTPDAGVRDVYAAVGFKLSGWRINTLYHDFSAEKGSADFGTEIDISAFRKIGKHYDLLIKTAWFSSDSASFADARKIWLQFSASYP